MVNHFPLSGRALEMSSLTAKFIKCLQEKSARNEIVNYRTEELKKKMENMEKHFKSDITFANQRNKSASQIVYSSVIELKDIINSAVEYKKTLSYAIFSLSDGGLIYETETSVTNIHAAAGQLRKEIENTIGINIFPLDPNDISQEKAESLLPSNLIKFLCWLCDNQAVDPSTDSRKYKKILSIAQDIINVSSIGRKLMPKCVGLAVALKTRLNSKEFVEICNKNGHCMSYDTVLRIESCWADEILNNDEGYACIPNIIASDIFTQAVADNSDYGQANSSQHITNTILLQYPNEHNFNFNVNVINTVVKKKSRRKSIILQPIPLTDLLLNKQPPSPNYFQSINIDLLLLFSKSFAMEIMKSTDTTWILSRSIPSKVFEMKDVNAQLVPGWTGFHSLLSSKVSIPTTIGYCRSIPAAPTNPNVVLTMMINGEKMLSSIGRTNAVLTVDESIYEIAKRIQFQLAPSLIIWLLD